MRISDWSSDVCSSDLAKGGRVNFFGFLLRLAARLPFLFVAGRVYGAETLGRFAYADLVVEFAAQLATLGLKRGLAGELARPKRPNTHLVYDALRTTMLASDIATAVLLPFPHAPFTNTSTHAMAPP